GAQVVVDVANSPSFADQAAMDFFQTAGKNLAAAEAAAGIKHHVALSVVGTERSLFQPMAAEDVATAVAEAAVAEPVNGTMGIAGPDACPMDEMVGKFLEYDKARRTVLGDPEALYFGVKLNDQSLIPGPNARHGSTKFAGWLTHVPPQKK